MNATVDQVMKHRLTRGSPVVVAESFKRTSLRGATMLVASKGVVKCNKGGRCAGDWCIGQAVFVMSEKAYNEESKMGWRSGTTKVCLTHLRDTEGEKLLPLALVTVAMPSLPDLVPEPESDNGIDVKVVTWEALSQAYQGNNIQLVMILARKLKTDNEKLQANLVESQGQVIETQEKLIAHLTR